MNSHRLASAVVFLLGTLAAPVLTGSERLLDIGTGTAQLALGAVSRWPGVSIVGVDPSAGMAAVADTEADRLLSGADRGRFRSVVAFADTLPFTEGEIDLVMIANAIHMMTERQAFLAEVRRVLSPRGAFVFNSAFFVGTLAAGTEPGAFPEKLRQFGGWRKFFHNLASVTRKAIRAACSKACGTDSRTKGCDRR